jgi:AcrR family transcriptional regulator
MTSITKRSHTARAERRDRIRARLLAAVEELLRDGESFAELPVERIAASAGVSRSTFYVYFADKTELLQGWLDDIFTEVAAAARHWYQLPPGATEAQVRNVLGEVLGAYRPHAGLMSAVADAAAYDPVIRDELAAHMNRQIHGLTRYIHTGQTTTAIDPTLPAEETASWLVWMAERGLHQLMRNITDQRADAIIFNTLYRAT